jgi:outer membrane protein TolC
MKLRTARPAAILPLMVLPLAGCLVGPDYHRPPPASPPAAQYKELPGWTQAAPADAAPKGDWWTDFHDPLLDQLEPMVRVSNQTVRPIMRTTSRRWRWCGSQRELYPTIGATGSVTRSRGGGGTAARGTGKLPHDHVNHGVGRRHADLGSRPMGKGAPHDRGKRGNAQSSEATLANATLSEQVTARDHG